MRLKNSKIGLENSKTPGIFLIQKSGNPVEYHTQQASSFFAALPK